MRPSRTALCFIIFKRPHIELLSYYTSTSNITIHTKSFTILHPSPITLHPSPITLHSSPITLHSSLIYDRLRGSRTLASGTWPQPHCLNAALSLRDPNLDKRYDKAEGITPSALWPKNFFTFYLLYRHNLNLIYSLPLLKITTKILTT